MVSNVGKIPSGAQPQRGGSLTFHGLVAEVTQHVQHRLAVPLLELHGGNFHREADALQREHHLGHAGVGVVVLLDLEAGVRARQLEQPRRELQEELELPVAVVRLVGEVRARNLRVARLFAELTFVVQCLQLLDEVLVHLVHVLRAGKGGRRSSSVCERGMV